MGVGALQLIQFVSVILNINMKLKLSSGPYYSFTVQKPSKYWSETKSNWHTRMYSWI